MSLNDTLTQKGSTTWWIEELKLAFKRRRNRPNKEVLDENRKNGK